MWWERLPSVEMSVFQEELIARGLKEHADEVDEMPASVQFPIMYTAVLAGECLEEINKVNESTGTPWGAIGKTERPVLQGLGDVTRRP